MHVKVKRFNSSLTAFPSALFYGIAFASVPFLWVSIIPIQKGLFVGLATIVFVLIFIFRFADNNVNAIELTDNELRYTSVRYGKSTIKSIRLTGIAKVVVVPGRSGVFMCALGINHLDTFVVSGYTLPKLSEVIHALEKHKIDTGRPLYIENQVKVDAKDMLKIILIAVAIVIVISVVAVWLVTATGNVNIS